MFDCNNYLYISKVISNISKLLYKEYMFFVQFVLNLRSKVKMT